MIKSGIMQIDAVGFEMIELGQLNRHASVLEREHATPGGSFIFNGKIRAF